ncbi:MAG: hypothetical protein HY364_01555 [Candidatus Aenigmarchaeota archaeon]|nr:hypothetical protein [Candidatus Aenigmarchaeota archaeon]
MVSKIIIFGAIIALLVGGIGYIYFGVISPSSEKPSIEKPILLEGQDISEEHVSWLANELGAYKIHNSLSGEAAEIEIFVEGTAFTVTNSGNSPSATKGNAANPDIRITADKASFAELINSENINSKIAQLYASGKIGVEILKDEATLALKGYKAVYDQISGNA